MGAGLQLQALGLGQGQALQRGPAVVLKGCLRVGRQRLCYHQRPFLGLPRPNHLLDQAHPQGVVGVYEDPRVHEVEGVAQADDAGQPLGAAV
jgi:hypothetical protein